MAQLANLIREQVAYIATMVDMTDASQVAEAMGNSKQVVLSRIRTTPMLSPADATACLHALRTSQVSTEFFLADGTLNQHDGIDNVPEAHLTGRPLGNAGAFGFGLKPNSSNVPVLIQLRSSVGRFKVVSLVSC